MYDVLGGDLQGDAVRAALSRAVDGPASRDLAAAAAALGGLPPPSGYTLSCFRAQGTDRVLYVMWEPRRPVRPHGRGTIVWSPNARRPLVVEAPHPKADRHTEYLAIETFLRSHARALLIAGAHRYALDEPADPPPYALADVAHDERSAFEAMHRAAVRSRPSGVVVQLHGWRRAKSRTSRESWSAGTPTCRTTWSSPAGMAPRAPSTRWRPRSKRPASREPTRPPDWRARATPSGRARNKPRGASFMSRSNGSCVWKAHARDDANIAKVASAIAEALGRCLDAARC
jgi:hypothetical protein